MSLRDQVRAGISDRTDFVLQPYKVALVVNDIQKYLESTDSQSYLATIASPRTIANVAKLTSAFRKIRDKEWNSSTSTSSCGGTAEGSTSLTCEVIFVYLQCSTKDGRDISLDYKLSGPLLNAMPRVGTKPEDIFLPECYPDIPQSENDTTNSEKRPTSKGDILIPKTSCSVFRSTNIDYVLRNLGIEQVVIVGQLTDQCILSEVRDAADYNYFVTVVEDACAAENQEDHDRGISCMKGFCRIVSTNQVLSELQNMERKLIESQEKNVYDVQQQKHKRICLGGDIVSSTSTSSTVDTKHELVSLPRKTKFHGSEIVESVGLYPQAKCYGCSKRVRTYCKCSPGTIRCPECYGKHLVEVEVST